MLTLPQQLTHTPTYTPIPTLYLLPAAVLLLPLPWLALLALLQLPVSGCVGMIIDAGVRHRNIPEVR